MIHRICASSSRVLAWALLMALLVPVVPAWAQHRDDEADLAEKVDVLAEELARLREEMAIPATEEERLDGRYGMSPVASKVYGGNPGLSIGGYGEFYYASQLEEVAGSPGRSRGDLYRVVTYFGYKFSERIVMNTEIEFEHATTGANFAGSSGEVSVEFAYLDFLITRGFNLRTGNLLIPMGFLNALHEPIFYRGNFRPEVERRVIPTTWRELGAGAHGAFGSGFEYTAYLVNGLNGNEFSTSGVRGGRQGGGQVAFEDLGVVGALDWKSEQGVWLGASGYYGGADQNGMTREDGALDPLKLSNWIAEFHAQYRHRSLDARFLFAASGIDGAEELSPILYEDPSSSLIPEGQIGWYLEFGYDLAPLLFGRDAGFTLSPWARFESLRLQDRVPTLAGRSADPALEQEILVIGIESKPHDQVVLKLDYVHTQTAAQNDPSDEFRLGAGFAF